MVRKTTIAGLLLTKEQEAEARLAPRVCLRICLGAKTRLCHREADITRRLGTDTWLLYCPSHGFIQYEETEVGSIEFKDPK